MEVVSLLHPSTTIQRAPAHVGALFSALKADNHLGSNGRRIPSYIKSNRNGIGHVGVAYDESKRSRVIVPRASSTTAISKEADLLGSITILTASGKPVEFRDLWDQNNGMAVVALLRHFGCVCCWELTSTLKDVKPKFDLMGVKLIAIGVGTPEKARILAERAYNALGLYHGLDRTFLNPASAKVFSRFDSFQKSLKNYTVSATPQDISSVLQQGGMYVFKGKELLYARKDEGTGDHAPLDEVLNICCIVPVS